jgi:uncharacterized protein YqgV (UPF0045/DUF77 family)
MPETKKHEINSSEVYLAFQVIPRMREGNNFELVDKAIEIVKQANIPYQVSAMETTMKGELNHLLDIVKAAQQACIDNGAVEVMTNIKIHYRTADATDTFCTYERGVTKNNAMFIDP